VSDESRDYSPLISVTDASDQIDLGLLKVLQQIERTGTVFEAVWCASAVYGTVTCDYVPLNTAAELSTLG
jgi:hypothetical protein